MTAAVDAADRAAIGLRRVRRIPRVATDASVEAAIADLLAVSSDIDTAVRKLRAGESK